MWMLLLVLVLVIGVACFLQHRYSVEGRRCAALEAAGIGPIYRWRLPFVGHVGAFFDEDRFSADALKKKREPGIGYVSIMGNVLVIVKDFELAKEFLDKMVRISKPKMSEMYVPIEIVFGGTSLLSEPSDQLHAEIRKAMAQGFKNRNLAKVKGWIYELLRELESEWRARGVGINVSKAMSVLTFRVITFVLFGKRLSVEQVQAPMESLHVLLEGSANFSKNPITASIALLSHRHRSALRTLQSFAQSLLDDIPMDSEDDVVLGSHMKRVALGNARLLSETLLVIFGGYETTANTTATAIYLTMQHEPWVERLKEDVAKVGDEVFLNFSSQSMVAEALFKEALRLYNGTPGGTVRRVPPEGMQLGKFGLPPGVGVVALQQTFHTDKANFEDPLAFHPERWLPNSPLGGEALLVPFSVGPRNCVGLPLANLEGPTLIAYILSRLRLRIANHPNIFWRQVMQCESFLVDVESLD